MCLTQNDQSEFFFELGLLETDSDFQFCSLHSKIIIWLKLIQLAEHWNWVFFVNSVQIPGVAETKLIKTIKLNVKVTLLNFLQLAFSAP